jgi:predicted aldo/keto reductase-like oxidoreductase
MPSPDRSGPLRRNERAPMQYRRFGKTNRMLSVITLGGMRYHEGWTPPRDELPARSIEQCKDTVLRALDLGINHIETAHGYGKSEHLYGKVLNEELRVPRERYFMMTKGAPETGDETRRLVEQQLKALKLDFIDLYAWHGINNQRRYDIALLRGGPVETLLRLKEEGLIGSVGFSTHGTVKQICGAIDTDLFDFVNLHYYYFWQRNYCGVQLAAARDMGVFVISPNDKGGHLFNPPPLLRELTAPLTPIQFNARFCLRTPLVQTLSFGVNQPEHFEEIPGIFPVSIPLSATDAGILARLDARITVDPLSAYEGYELDGDPSGINIQEVLRFRRMLKCYDMRAFGRYRYNMFEPDSEWFWGAFATDENIEKVDVSRVPRGIPLREMLRETHRELYDPKAAG